MGLLSPGPEKREGYFVVGRKKPPVKALGDVYRPCDRCGHSTDNQPIAKALYQVETAKGSLYFCGNHFRKHSDLIFEKGYPVQELRRSEVKKATSGEVAGGSVFT